MKPAYYLLLFFSLMAIQSKCQVNEHDSGESKKYEIEKTEEEWKAILSPEQFDVLRNKATECAFTGEYFDFKGKGIFVCAGCNNELFETKTKYNSGSGWPSFYAPIKEGVIEEIPDNSYGMMRTEILCSKCGGHLGHLFEDGPRPTGLRYCVNSAAIHFIAK